MKNKLYYSFLIFLSKPGMSLFIAFELFILIFAANFALGQYNSKTMLYEPVAGYIERQGFVAQEAPMLPPPDNGPAEYRSEDGTVIITDDASAPAEHPKISDLLKDVDVMTLRHFFIGEFDITVLPDDVFDKLRLPVAEGRLFKSSSTDDALRVIMTPNTKGYKAGDTVTLPQQTGDSSDGTVSLGADLEIKISAVLTDPTYIMHFSYSYDMSYENMYMNYDSSYYRDQFFCYTCQSELDRCHAAGELVNDDMTSLVSFRNDVSDEEYDAAKAALQKNGYTVTDNSLILENSRIKLEDNFRKLLPAVAVFGVIVLIGIVSCSVIGTKTMLKKLSIFYCCGATKGSCIAVSVGQTVITGIIAVIASTAATLVFTYSRLSDKFGFVFRTNNLLMSAGMILGAVLISAAAPTVLISKADPRELLTETAEE